MKIDHRPSEVITSSNNQSTFTIKASAHAFRILSDGLYQYKIAAIVRELSCNAYDSHVEAGKPDLPFKVTLPNAVHPFFEIEDFGVGLDDKSVRTVATVYFESTKTETNDQIGGLGLGFKTPFSYTDSYTIRARKDGVERLYSAYIDTDGSPNVNLVSEIQTTEGNGVKITVPVKSQDFREFQNEASFILSMFETKPDVDLEGFEFFMPNIVEKLNQHGIATESFPYSPSSLYSSNLFIVMGSVCYPYNDYELERSISNDPQVYNYYKRIIKSNSYHTRVFIRYGIGELDVAASRESLSIDERTKQKLADTLTDKIRALIEADEEEINQCEHPMDVVKKVSEKYSLGALSYNILKYRGTSIVSISERNVFSHFFTTKRELMGYAARRTTYGSIVATKMSTDNITYGRLSTVKNLKIVYLTEGEKSTGIITEVRSLIKRLEDVALAFAHPLSDREREAIEKKLGTNVEWLKLSELRAARKAKNGPNGNTATTSSSFATAIKKTEINCTYETITPTRTQNFQRNRVDISEPITVDHEIYYTSAGLTYGLYEIQLGGVSVPVDNNLMSMISKYYDKKYTIVRYNRVTAKKIDAVGVQPVETLVTKFAEEVKSLFILNQLRNNRNSNFIELEKLPKINFWDEGLEIATHSSQESIQTATKTLNRLLQEHIDNIPEDILDDKEEYDGLYGYYVHHSTRAIINVLYGGEITELQSQVDELVDQIKSEASKHHPLLALEYWNEDQKLNKKEMLIQYIKSVDSNQT